ncbi:MAG TPA: right-handed parallel beta-helix repeat-containing protein, partial [Polyangiaceae bacterium]
MLRTSRVLALAACASLGVLAPAACSSSKSGGAPSGCEDDVCVGEGGAHADGSSSSGSGSGSGAHADSGSGSGSGSGSSSGAPTDSGSGGSSGGDAPHDSGADTSDGADAVALVPAFYVSPAGDDKNPGTLAQPFLTLGKAQTAMQASTTIKTTYVRAGTYDLKAATGTSNCDYGMGSTAIDLNAADAGETWSYYPPDGFGTAILDGGSTSTTTGVACAFAGSSAPKLTFVGLQMQHFQYSGIWVSSSPNLVARNNTIHDLTVGIFNIGGIVAHTSSDVTIANNFIHDVAYVGIGTWGG